MQPAVHARCGHVFEVNLTEIPASGYIWRVSEVPGGFILLDQGYGDDSPEPIGAPRQRQFRFRASERPGAFTVRFLLQRPWEPAASQDQVVTVVVE